MNLPTSSPFDAKWFAREVRSISIRNLRLPNSSSSGYESTTSLPSPCLEVVVATHTGRVALYTGKVVPFCSNPSWTMATMLPATDAWKVDAKGLSNKLLYPTTLTHVVYPTSLF